MSISAKTIRHQLTILRPLLNARTIESMRKGQNRLGELMEARYRKQLIVKDHNFEQFDAAWIIPKDERRQGVILYLHGGGYCCGDLEYAKGFGATLSYLCGGKVFCPAYRLAPEYPFPAALEDALEAYRYLLSKGYQGLITLCGESAGGGLCFALCQRLKEVGLPMPCGIIAISPWTDMTASGESYQANRDVDPTMSIQSLSYYAEQYTKDRTNPLVSPIFADLSNMPPALIFVGGDEIMLSDASMIHKKLLAAGCKSQLQIAPERWHSYLLYNLSEDQNDYSLINRFLNQHMAQERKLRWLRLDNAAKLFPASLRQNWSSIFRLSATLSEPVDVSVLQVALDVTVRRFPSIAARLRRGLFWHYLQQLDHAPPLTEENSFPLARMTRAEIRRCGLRVIVYERRIAVEFFHALTDGNGGLVFLKTLVAEYLQQKYGIYIPAEHGVLGRLDEPSSEELADSFLEYAGTVSEKPSEQDAWQLTGTPSVGEYHTVTCFRVPVKNILEKAHEYGVSLTTFLCATMMMALQNIQKQQVPEISRRKLIKVLLPINLRQLFPSKSLRNFMLYTITQIDPRLGEYDFSEICAAIQHRMGLDITRKTMSARIAANVSNERPFAVKIIPLFLKNAVMRAIFDLTGERKSCISISNLGVVQIPDVMHPYVERFDFILGVQATKPCNCSVLSFKDTLYLNFIRKIDEPILERNFFYVLRDMGIPVLVESNQQKR